jgi:hypothetical protein
MISDLGFVGATPVSKGAALGLIDKQYFIPARASASAADEVVLDRISTLSSNFPTRLASIEVIPAGDVTGHGTNYVTLQLCNRKSDGSGTDILATLTLNTVGTYGKYVPMSFTLDGSKAPLKNGDVLTLVTAVAAGGQTTPAMTVRVRFSA